MSQIEVDYGEQELKDLASISLHVWYLVKNLKVGVDVIEESIIYLYKEHKDSYNFTYIDTKIGSPEQLWVDGEKAEDITFTEYYAINVEIKVKEML